MELSHQNQRNSGGHFEHPSSCDSQGEGWLNESDWSAEVLKAQTMHKEFLRFAIPKSVLAVTLSLCQFGCMSRQEKLSTEQDSSPRVEPIQLTDRTFQDTILGSSQIVLVDMWAPWCRPCIRMKPTIQELAQQLKGKVMVAELNVDQNLFTKEKYQINQYPTVLVFNRGIEVKRLIGTQSKENLLDALEVAKNANDGLAVEK